MKRIDFPLKDCLVCGLTMRRKRYGARLEKPLQYAKRLTCNHACGARMLAGRMRKEFDRTAHIRTAAPGEYLGACCRCARPCVLRYPFRNAAGWIVRQKRCPDCRRVGGNGGSGTVTFLRRRSEAR